MFSIWDGEDYLYTGRNSKTKDECIQAGIDFVFEDSEEVIEEGASFGTKELRLNGAGYIIEEHTEYQNWSY